MKTKICVECGQEKPESAFYIGRRRKDGTIYRKVRCKSCIRATVRQHTREKNGGEVRERPKYNILSCPGNIFGGRIPVTGFSETLRAGYFPPGMVVEKSNGKVYEVVGAQLTRQKLKELEGDTN